MFTFRRALRWFFTLAGLILGAATAISAFVARTMIAPARQNLNTTPASRGLPFEDVQFPAQDGLRVSGWFVPADGKQDTAGPAVVLVHGWQWNRAGYDNQNLFSNLTGSTPISFFPLIEELHAGGYHVLTLDLRNHGESAADHPVTFGQSEAKDLLGSLAYLESRDDVDADRIGALGFSIGANSILFALPQTDLIEAAIVAQPMTPSLFTRRVTNDLFGVLGSMINTVSVLFYQLFGGPRLSGILPAFVASGSGNVPLLFLQGTGDEWGSVEDVSLMADRTPGTKQLLFVNSQHRFGGYDYLLNNPSTVTQFFTEYLARD